MNPTIAVDFTRIGLACDFLAFFLAAPEILGESRIRKIQNNLRTILIFFSFGFFIISIISTIAMFLFWIVIPTSNIVATATALSLVTGYRFSTTELTISYLLFSGGCAFFSWISTRMMKISEHLSTNANFRRQSLNLGILIFVVGAIAQFIGTF
jgi:hypothetical protein